MQDTYNYMDGSAAVIGDFMLPILMPGNDPETVAARARGTLQRMPAAPVCEGLRCFPKTMIESGRLSGIVWEFSAHTTRQRL